MSEIFREIEQELRQERWLILWRRVQPYAIGGAIGLVLLIGGWTGWQFYARAASEKISDDFDAALILSDKKQRAAAFADLAEQGGSYGALASFHEAALYAQTGRRKQAVDIYDNLSTLARLPLILRDLARVNAATLLIGYVSYDELAKRLRRVAGDNAPLRYSAREVLALAALNEKNHAAARAWLEPLLADAKTPQTLAARAQIMLNGLPPPAKPDPNASKKAAPE